MMVDANPPGMLTDVTLDISPRFDFLPCRLRNPVKFSPNSPQFFEYVRHGGYPIIALLLYRYTNNVTTSRAAMLSVSIPMSWIALLPADIAPTALFK